jgi:hypothetical protein
MNIYKPRAEILIHAELALNQLETAVLFALGEASTVGASKEGHCLLHSRKGLPHEIVFIAKCCI